MHDQPTEPQTAVFKIDEPTRAALLVLAEAESFSVEGREIRVPPYLRNLVRSLATRGFLPVGAEPGWALQRAVNALETANELLRTEADADEDDCEDAKEVVREARAALASLGVPTGLFFCTDDGIEQFVEVGNNPLSVAMPKMCLNPGLSWEMRDENGALLDMARSAAECNLAEGNRIFVTTTRQG